jgi:head-tail adaptor
MIGVQTPNSARIQRVSLDAPGPPVSDGDGGFTQTYAPLTPPALWGEIKPATVRDIEQLASGTVLSAATLLVFVPFHPDVTTQTRVTWTDNAKRSHTANVVGLVNVDERCRELVLGVVEVVP